MSIEMQRLYLKEIVEELSDIDRILNREYNKISKKWEEKLVEIHHIVKEEDYD